MPQPKQVQFLWLGLFCVPSLELAFNCVCFASFFPQLFVWISRNSMGMLI